MRSRLSRLMHQVIHLEENLSACVSIALARPRLLDELPLNAQMESIGGFGI